MSISTQNLNTRSMKLNILVNVVSKHAIFRNKKLSYNEALGTYGMLFVLNLDWLLNIFVETLTKKKEVMST